MIFYYYFNVDHKNLNKILEHTEAIKTQQQRQRTKKKKKKNI